MEPIEDIPVTYIRPPKGWMALNFRELWQYRELLFFFSWRDMKVKYKQTLLGVAWAVIGPLAHALIFTVIFGRVAKLPTDGLPPSVFYLAGMVIWQYFSTALNNASNSLVVSSAMLTRIYFPRLLVPLSACLTGLVDLFVAFGVLILTMLLFHAIPAWTSLLLPFLVLIAVCASFGVGLFFAALNVRYRDVRVVVPFIVQMWMYCTVILPFSRIPERWGIWRYAYGLNPMAGVVEGFRWCLLKSHMFTTAVAETVLPGMAVPGVLAEGQKIAVKTLDGGVTQVVLQEMTRTPVEAPLTLILIGAPVAILLLLCGLLYFRRVENQFADII